MSKPNPDSSSQGNPDLFPPTLWTLVLQATSAEPAKAQAAMGQLCELYRRPIHVCVRLRVHDRHATDDLTQQFIEHLLKPERLAAFERRPGSKFRSYLVKSLENFLNDCVDKANAEKRGGGAEHIPIELPTEEGGARPVARPADPAQVLDREVALAIHQRVLSRLEEKLVKGKKRDRFVALRDFIFGDPPSGGFTSIAGPLGTTANAIRQELFRMRDDYYDFFRAEVAQIVSREEVDEEMKDLISLLPEEYGPTDRENPS